MIKVYCEACDKDVEYIIETVTKKEDEIYGDMLCKKCKLILLTIVADREGNYDLRRVK